jgi:hypothetical protein
MATGSENRTASAMIEALRADGPHPDLEDRLMLFGRLIGSWDIVSRYFDQDGKVTRETTGEWHFGLVLEGRVIQDVIISPPLRGRVRAEPSMAYDTAIRAYDPKSDTVNRVDPRHEEPAQLVHVLGLGAHDDVNGSKPQQRSPEATDSGRSRRPLRAVSAGGGHARVRSRPGGFVLHPQGDPALRS